PQAPNRLRVEAPGFNARQLDLLIEVLTRLGVLTFNLVDIDASPDDYTVGEERNGRIALPNSEMNGEIQVLFSDAIITGEDLARASRGYDQSNRPNIQFRLHPLGAKKFGKATSDNIGRPFAIVLDNRIITAPNIQSPIMTGSGEIT